ncbi:hypothetical protein [Enterococcus malodoratus]|uniref:hypothetical protein n=1 Tax=Enterococcus malodoratus TaxID=71451 RepID=UPI0022E069E5|nr:hypothetical protein [Enterococcus malodoratus]
MIDVRRNLGYIVVTLVTTVFCYFKFEFSPKSFINYKEIMSSGLSFAAIGSAILILGLSFFPFSKGKGLITSVYNKILESVVMGTIFYFLQSGLSLMGLFINSTSSTMISKVFMNLWIGIGITCVIITINILKMILKEIASSLK